MYLFQKSPVQKQGSFLFINGLPAINAPWQFIFKRAAGDPFVCETKVKSIYFASHTLLKNNPLTMYGIVNIAIEDHIKKIYGPRTWEQVCEVTGIHKRILFSDNSQQEELCYSIAQATSKLTKHKLPNVLQRFGHYFIRHISREEMGILMLSGGSTLKQFIYNIPKLEKKLMLIYPKVHFNKIDIDSPSSNQLHLSYYPDRHESIYFFVGVLQGIAALFNQEVKIDLNLSDPKAADIILHLGIIKAA